MRLLVDCHCFDAKTTEGINTYLKGIYTILPEIAPEIEFYFAARNINKIKSIFGNGKNIHYVKLSDKNKFYRLIFEFPRIINKYKIDWAHYQYTSPLIKNCKTIVTLHDILFKDFPEQFPKSYRLIKDFTFKRSARMADTLCTVSDYSKERISYHYHIDRKEIIVTPNAVSEEFNNIDKNLARKFVESKGINRYLLYVSRREPRKNQIAVLKAWDRYCNRSEKLIDLVFIGRPTIPMPVFDDYLNHLDENKKKHVYVIDNASFEDLKFWYAAADLFVYPAVAEGFGIPPIEAAMAGIPVICNKATAMGDFNFFGDCLIDINDNELLDEKIKRQLESPYDTDNVKRCIQEKYNWRNSAEILKRALFNNN